MIALPLVSRSKRVYLRKLRPADRYQFSGRIEFHGAASQRDHRMVETEVLIFQRLQVTHHFTFTVVCIENGVKQKRRCAGKRGRNVIKTRIVLKHYPCVGNTNTLCKYLQNIKQVAL